MALRAKDTSAPKRGGPQLTSWARDVDVAPAGRRAQVLWKGAGAGRPERYGPEAIPARADSATSAATPRARSASGLVGVVPPLPCPAVTAMFVSLPGSAGAFTSRSGGGLSRR